MPGLIGTGESFQQLSRSTLGDAARLEEINKQENMLQKQAKKTNQASLAGAGAALGATIGGSIAGGASAGSAAGPWGTVIGAGVGLIAGYLGGGF